MIPSSASTGSSALAVLLTEHRLDAVFPRLRSGAGHGRWKAPALTARPQKLPRNWRRKRKKERLYYGLPAPGAHLRRAGADPIPPERAAGTRIPQNDSRDAKPQAEEPVKQEPEREDKPVLSCKGGLDALRLHRAGRLRGAELQLYKRSICACSAATAPGKTTLLSCLIGTAKPQRGKVGLQKNCRLAMLPQRPQALSRRTMCCPIY